MSKVIIYKNDGGLCVIHPSHKCNLTIEQIAAKDVPTGHPYKIVDVSDLPANRDFRPAWDIDDSKLTDGKGA